MSLNNEEEPDYNSWERDRLLEQLLIEKRDKEWLECKYEEEKKATEYLQSHLAMGEDLGGRLQNHLGDLHQILQQLLYIVGEVKASKKWKIGCWVVDTLNFLRGKKKGEIDFTFHFEELRKNYASCQKPQPMDDQIDNYEVECRDGLLRFIENKDTLDLSVKGEADLSIVLVLFNRAELTLACLKSIQDDLGGRAQVIMVDNASSDETSVLLSQLRGVEVLTMNENLGFLQACNLAVEKVTTEVLLFLNNDAELLRGSVDQALKTLSSSSDIGVVGGKILKMDGSLQEAGSMVFHDGSCAGYGRGEDPEHFSFDFVREVDYCSGAFLLTRSKLFFELGRFDTDFTPAYYEEVDFCMRVRAHGLKVIYDPHVVIKHVEFASSSDPAEALALQEKHRDIFKKKHQLALKCQLSPHESNTALSRHAPPRKPSILLIDDRVPLDHLGSGFPRTRALLDLLVKKGYFVTFLPLTFPETGPFAPEITGLPNGMEIARGVGTLHLKEFLMNRRGVYDFVWISRPHNLRLAFSSLASSSPFWSSVRLIYDAEAIFSFRDKIRANIRGEEWSEDEFGKVLEEELRPAESCQAIITVSKGDADIFKKRFPHKSVNILPNRLESQVVITNPKGRVGFLFIGNLDHKDSPNVDSLIWFCETVWPMLREKLGDVELEVVGSAEADGLKETLAGVHGVHLVGPVKDTVSHYARARVFLAPTRFAAGIPCKILEAASHGLAVACTELLAHQLAWSHLKGAKDAQDLIELCYRLYCDDDEWTDQARKNLDSLREHCHPTAFDRTLDQVLTGSLASES